MDINLVSPTWGAREEGNLGRAADHPCQYFIFKIVYFFLFVTSITVLNAEAFPFKRLGRSLVVGAMPLVLSSLFSPLSVSIGRRT